MCPSNAQFSFLTHRKETILYLYSRAVSLSKGILFSKVVLTFPGALVLLPKFYLVEYHRHGKQQPLGGMAQAPERSVCLFVHHFFSNRYSIFLLTLQVSSVIYNSKYHPSYQQKRKSSFSLEVNLQDILFTSCRKGRTGDKYQRNLQ